MVLMFLMAVILYRTIVTVIIYESGSFLTGSVSTTVCLTDYGNKRFLIPDPEPA